MEIPSENFRVIVAIPYHSVEQSQFVKFHFMLFHCVLYTVFLSVSWHFSHFILFLVVRNTVSIDLSFMAFITFSSLPLLMLLLSLRSLFPMQNNSTEVTQNGTKRNRFIMSFNLIKNLHQML